MIGGVNILLLLMAFMCNGIIYGCFHIEFSIFDMYLFISLVISTVVL